MSCITPMTLTPKSSSNAWNETHRSQMGLAELAWFGSIGHPTRATPQRVGQQRAITQQPPTGWEPATSGLGSAQAGSRWGWAEPQTQPPMVASTPAAPHAWPAMPTPTTGLTPAPMWPATASHRAAPSDGASSRALTAPAARSAAPIAIMETTSERAHAIVEGAAPGLAQTIAEAAQLLGRDESVIWAEAAREWLSHHLGLVAIGPDDAHDDPPPTAPAAAVAVMTRRTNRCWSAIDALLADLRAPAA